MHLRVTVCQVSPSLDADSYRRWCQVATKIEVIDSARPRSRNDNNYKQCVICLELMGPRSVVRRLPCDHFFHRECADENFKFSKNCPICKQEVSAPE